MLTRAVRFSNLCDTQWKPTLIKLDLSGNTFGTSKSCIEDLLSRLKNMPALQYVDLSCCRIDRDEHIAAFAELLEACPDLRFLDLRGNLRDDAAGGGISLPTLERFGEAMKNNRKMRFLGLDVADCNDD